MTNLLSPDMRVWVRALLAVALGAFLTPLVQVLAAGAITRQTLYAAAGGAVLGVLAWIKREPPSWANQWLHGAGGALLGAVAGGLADAILLHGWSWTAVQVGIGSGLSVALLYLQASPRSGVLPAQTPAGKS